MKLNWKKTLWAGMGAALLVSVPLTVKSDGISFGVNFGTDNEIHYHAHGWHHPEMRRAAEALITAKKRLWYARGNFGGYRERAMRDINLSLDEISMAEDYAHRH
ncbi:MAG TPA: hypothetical protein VK791_05870 [bacterium]|jgi:hypothetical protein|nr:hypothetical protein [bacterium]